MLDKEWVRPLALAGFCLILPIYNWHYLIAPSHRAMTLLVLTAVFVGALFYELTMRDAPVMWVLAGVLGVIALAVLSWIGLQLFAIPLANDHAPLLAAQDSSARAGCPIPAGSFRIKFGSSEAVGTGDGPFTPFRVGVCAGPNVTRTPGGLLVNAFGYDDDGTLIYRIRSNQFDRVQGDYLHLHRTDRSTLALYDKDENEIFYLRYLSPNAVQIRGRFLCGDASPVTIGNNEIAIGERDSAQPACIALKPGPAPNIARQTH